jgi:hypothetical protein
MIKRASTAAVALALLGALATPVPAADVHVGINVGVPPPPSLVFESPPRLVVVPEAPEVRYAPDVSVNFFAYGDQYYAYDGGHWFVSHAERGPWAYVDRHRVPRQVLLVPTRYYHGKHGHDGGPHGHGNGHHKVKHHHEGHGGHDDHHGHHDD